MGREGLRDFPASQPFAGLIDEGPGSSAPQKRLPADKKSTEQALASLKAKTDFRPPTEEDQKPLPPVVIFPNFNKLDLRDRQELTKTDKKKQLQRSLERQLPLLERHSEEPLITLVSNTRTRNTILWSEANHDKTLFNREQRIKYGLPKRAASSKVLTTLFKAFSEEDINYLHNQHFHPEMVKNTHSVTVERMLLALGRYPFPKQKKQPVKV